MIKMATIRKILTIWPDWAFEYSLKLSLVVGEAFFIEMDNEIVEKIVNREFQMIRTVMKRDFL
jgi:c-di-AMP phosphodiesterase-like protein